MQLFVELQLALIIYIITSKFARNYYNIENRDNCPRLFFRIAALKVFIIKFYIQSNVLSIIHYTYYPIILITKQKFFFWFFVHIFKKVFIISSKLFTSVSFCKRHVSSYKTKIFIKDSWHYEFFDKFLPIGRRYRKPQLVIVRKLNSISEHFLHISNILILVISQML